MRAASSLAMPASISQRRSASFSRAAKKASWREAITSAAIQPMRPATRSNAAMGLPNCLRSKA